MPSYNKVVYGGKVLIDLTNDTVDENSLLEGYTAHKSDGSVVSGKFKGGSEHEEIDRILAFGLTDGYKYYLDDGTIVSNSDAKQYTLTKTFSDDFSTCTTILRTTQGEELGRTVKTYSNGYLTITTLDRYGQKLVKEFSSDLKLCTIRLYSPTEKLLAKQEKRFADDGKTVETNVEYYD